MLRSAAHRLPPPPLLLEASEDAKLLLLLRPLVLHSDSAWASRLHSRCAFLSIVVAQDSVARNRDGER